MPDVNTIGDQIRARLAELEQLIEPLRAEAEHLTKLAATIEGHTAAALAKAMGIKANYLHRVLPRLEQEARVTKQGKGYHPTGDATATAPTNGQPVTA